MTDQQLIADLKSKLAACRSELERLMDLVGPVDVRQIEIVLGETEIEKGME